MRQPSQAFAPCVENVGHKASLIPRKIYRVFPDTRAARDDFVRIVDESGEDTCTTRGIFCLSSFREL